MREIGQNISEWIQNAPSGLLRLLGAIAIVIAALIVLRVGKRMIRRVYEKWRARHPRKLRDGETKAGAEKTAITLVASLYTYVIYFLAAVAVLKTLGVDVSSLLAVAGFGGVAIGFGCQTLVKDVISGLFLWVDGYIRVGDIVTVNGATGTVENVALRTTTVRGVNGNIIVIPNGDIRTVTNLTRDYRCALVDITVAHGQDYRRALEVLRQAMTEVDQAMEEIHEPPEVTGIISTDARAATIRIECRCRIDDCWKLERQIRLYALEAFRKEEIKP